MIKIKLTIFTCFIYVVSILAQTSPRLIVRVDDMGSSHAANLACIETYKKGIATSVEVMVVTPWFPEAVKLLKENPGLDAGLHLTLTSEWDNIKWRPLTNCPSIVDENGYLLPKIVKRKDNINKDIIAINDRNWNLDEIEQEFRAQIEMALRNIPRISHLSGHMGITFFNDSVNDLVKKLANEYNLKEVCSNPEEDYGIINTSYNGPKKDFNEKEQSFISMLNSLEKNKTYVFVDHPAYNNAEMQAVYHIGYENVAIDRQGVTDLLISETVKNEIEKNAIKLATYNEIIYALPRSTPKAKKVPLKNIEKYIEEAQTREHGLHSVMILKDGKVIFEKWFEDNSPDKLHEMFSVSKAFTSIAIGFAVAEKRISIHDKVISFFPDDLPDTVSTYLSELEISHLLTMTIGHENRYMKAIMRGDDNWIKTGLSYEIKYEPGTHFMYDNFNTYLLSAIIQEVTGQKLIDYLYPRLFRPLGITGAVWKESPKGINMGATNLHLKTEDMAKFGQFLLQNGNWNGKQLLPEEWIKEASTVKITARPVWVKPEIKTQDNDYLQGYGYQFWLNRNSGYRADGKLGQFVFVLPDQDAVIAITANMKQKEEHMDLMWKYLLPALE